MIEIRVEARSLSHVTDTLAGNDLLPKLGEAAFTRRGFGNPSSELESSQNGGPQQCYLGEIEAGGYKKCEFRLGEEHAKLGGVCLLFFIYPLSQTPTCMRIRYIPPPIASVTYTLSKRPDPAESCKRDVVPT